MKKRRSFGDSATARFLFRLIAPIMESPLRRKFFDPVKTLKGTGIRSGQEVLEVGCGTGFFTIPAAELVGDEGCVYAIDPHPLAMEQVAKKIRDAGLTNVRLIKADAIETPLASNSIDLVLLFGVIPSPILPLDRLLPEMYRLLKPDGALAVWTAFPWWSPASLTWGGCSPMLVKSAGCIISKKKRVTKVHSGGSRSRLCGRCCLTRRFPIEVGGDLGISVIMG